jgi:hypothetical protein
MIRADPGPLADLPAGPLSDNPDRAETGYAGIGDEGDNVSYGDLGPDRRVTAVIEAALHSLAQEPVAVILPLRPLFLVTSAFLFLMGLRFVGGAIQELQEQTAVLRPIVTIYVRGVVARRAFRESR